MSPDSAALATTLVAFQASSSALAQPEAGQRSVLIHLWDGDEGDSEEQAIAGEYQRRLAGLRGLPKGKRVGALRAVRLWRQAALRILRDKRAAARQARQMAQRWQIPPPV